jgi:hypothetical protein
LPAARRVGRRPEQFAGFVDAAANKFAGIIEKAGLQMKVK